MASINETHNNFESKNNYIINIIKDFENMKVHFDVINKIIDLTNVGNFIKFELIIKNGLSRLKERVTEQEISLQKWKTSPKQISLNDKSYYYQSAADFCNTAKKILV
jgi:hypothetical protein